MAVRRETFAALLSGDQVGATVTVQTVEGDLAEGVVRVLVHTAHAVAVFLGDDVMPTMVAPTTIAVVSSEAHAADVGLTGVALEGDGAGGGGRRCRPCSRG
jgi:hypothetical protein